MELVPATPTATTADLYPKCSPPKRGKYSVATPPPGTWVPGPRQHRLAAAPNHLVGSRSHARLRVSTHTPRPEHQVLGSKFVSEMVDVLGFS